MPLPQLTPLICHLSGTIRKPHMNHFVFERTAYRDYRYYDRRRNGDTETYFVSQYPTPRYVNRLQVHKIIPSATNEQPIWKAEVSLGSSFTYSTRRFREKTIKASVRGHLARNPAEVWNRVRTRSQFHRLVLEENKKVILRLCKACNMQAIIEALAGELKKHYGPAGVAVQRPDEQEYAMRYLGQFMDIDREALGYRLELPSAVMVD